MGCWALSEPLQRAAAPRGASARRCRPPRPPGAGTTPHRRLPSAQVLDTRAVKLGNAVQIVCRQRHQRAMSAARSPCAPRVPRQPRPRPQAVIRPGAGAEAHPRGRPPRARACRRWPSASCCTRRAGRRDARSTGAEAQRSPKKHSVPEKHTDPSALHALLRSHWPEAPQRCMAVIRALPPRPKHSQILPCFDRLCPHHRSAAAPPPSWHPSPAARWPSC